jgi:DHA1 family tetracycline resistance protein-like MFS transporter
MKSGRASVAFIFITLVLDIIGIGLVVPVLPRLIASYSGGVSSGSSTYGLFVAAYAFMQFVFAPVLGSLSDRYGRRSVLLVSLLGSALNYVLLALVPSLWLMFVARLIAGITGASVTTANAYIADVTPPDRRAQAFGLLGAAFGIGFIIGPALGGILGAISPRAPFWGAALLTAINLLYGFFVLPESLPAERRRAFSWLRANPIGALGALGRLPVVTLMAVTLFLTNFAQRGLETTWVLANSFRFGWGPLENGLSLAFVGLMVGTVQGGLIRRIVPRLGEWRSLVAGLALTAVAFLLYGLAPAGWTIYLIAVLSGLGSIAGPSAQAIVSQQVPPNQQGETQGALTSLASLTSVIAPLLAGGVLSYFTSDEAPAVIPGAPFLLGFVLLLGALAVARGAAARHALRRRAA